jgi:integrase
VLEGKKLPENLRKPSVKFNQLLDDALAYSKRNKRSYKTDVPRFASLDDWFGSHPAEELAPKEIENALARAADKEKWAPSTFNHYRSLMSLSYRLGILNRKVTCNPARSVTHRREDNNRVRFLTEEEEKKLRKVIEAKWPLHLPELDLAINTGLRKGSQYSLTWDMVDFRGRMLNVPRTKNEEPIHVPLNDAAVAALRVVQSRGEGKGRVFQSAKTGEPLENGAALVRRRGGRSADQELSLARLATYICEPFANEGRSAGRYCRPVGAQEFNDGGTRIWVRTSCMPWCPS